MEGGGVKMSITEDFVILDQIQSHDLHSKSSNSSLMLIHNNTVGSNQ